MSSNLSRNEREKNDTEKTKDKDEPQRQKLLREIRDLELLIKQVELSLGSSPHTFVKFGDIVHDVNKIMINHEKTSKEEVNNNRELVDTEATIKNELCWFAGVRSIKADDGFVFEFQSHEEESSYSIKILRESNTWKLDKWIMPMSIKIKDILANYVIDSPENIQLFIKECKHQIDCYGRRKKQYEELEAFFTDLVDYDCQLGKDYRRYMRIVITLGKRFSSNDKTPIVVYLHYRTNETLPSKITIEGDDLARPNFKLSDEKSQKLTALFKPFKKNNLRKAAEKILLSTEGQSMWKRFPSDVDDDIIDEGQDVESESHMTSILKKGSKRRKENGAMKKKDTERGKRKKDTESDNEINDTADSNDLSKMEISEVDEDRSGATRKIPKKGKRRAAKRKKC